MKQKKWLLCLCQLRSDGFSQVPTQAGCAFLWYISTQGCREIMVRVNGNHKTLLWFYSDNFYGFKTWIIPVGFFCFTSEWFVLLMAPTEKLRVHQRYYNSCREGLKCPHPVSRHFLSNNLGIFHSTPQGGAKGWHGTRCIIPSVALKALTSLKNWFGQI